ncbi:MAG: TlpA disulfide reductase family protein [Acidobacteriota bacterium]|nr:TlpA disulfide reductase family protein [Acidobacteriota bacterium]
MLEPLELFGWSIGWYPTMAVAAAVVGTIFFLIYSPRKAVFGHWSRALIYCLSIAVLGVVVSRVWSVAAVAWFSERWGSLAAFYRPLTLTEALSRGGLVWYGGFLPVLAWVLLLMVWIRGDRYLRLLDVTALMACIAYPVARTGCFLTGCCFGAWSDAPWAVYVRYGPHFSLVPKHPTNLFEVILHAGLFGILLHRDRKPHPAGTIAMEFIVGHAMVRFFIEFLRTHPEVALGLTSRQYISIGLVTAALLARRWMIRRAAAGEVASEAGAAAEANGRIVGPSAWKLAASSSAVLMLFVGSFAAADRLVMEPRNAGGQVPEVAFAGLDGGEVPLAELRGTPVVLNFWASWCAPCRTEIPELNQFRRDNPTVPLLGVGADEPPELSRRAAQELGITYPVVVADQRILELFGVLALPRTVVLDSSGRIAAVHSGTVTATQLEAMVASVEEG